MIVDLRWLDAWSEAGCFSQAEKDAGWPDAMEPEQLAALQRPGRELEQRRKRALLVSAITAACKQGALVHAVGVKQFVQPSKTYNPGFSTTAGNWPAAYVRDGRPLAYTTEARTIETSFFSIAPGDFAAWLHAAHEEPSAPIAVWFEVRGVAWPPVLAVDADTVADWPGLVVLVKSRRKGTRWTEVEVTILRAEFARRGGWSREADGQPWVKNSSIQSDMATELGFSARSALDRHLGDGPDRGAAVMSSAVGALTGTR